MGDKVTRTAPAQRFHGRRDMVRNTGSRDNPSPEVHYFLHSVKMTFSSAAPDRQAVKDVWENVVLNEKFSNLRREVVADFV